MASLLQARIRNNIAFKYNFLDRHSHVDYVYNLSIEIMNRYSRFFDLYRDKAKEIVERVAVDISSDPKRTAKAVVQYFGFGRYKNGEWDLSNTWCLCIDAEQYTCLKTRKEVNLNSERYGYDEALFYGWEVYKKQSTKDTTWLNTCYVCSKTSTPKKVNVKYGLMGWTNDKGDSYEHFKEIEKATLCTGCWNKIKALSKKEDEAREINRLINKLNRERLKWQKSQAQAS